MFSLVGHLTMGAASSLGWRAIAPQVAVQEASSSVDVNIIEEVIPPEPKKTEEILAAPIDEIEEVSPVKKKSPEAREAPQQFLPVPMRGAIVESRPDYLQNRAPIYPLKARMNGWEGVVLLRVSVEDDGTVDVVEVEQSSGYRILDDSSLKTVKTWRFLPAKLGNNFLRSMVKVPVRFKLRTNYKGRD